MKIQLVSEDNTESASQSNSDSNTLSETESDDYYNELPKDKNINIVFTLADPKSYYEEDEDSYYSESSEESFSDNELPTNKQKKQKTHENIDELDKVIENELNELNGLVCDLKNEILTTESSNNDQKSIQKINDKQILGKFINDVKSMKKNHDNPILDELIKTEKRNIEKLKKKRKNVIKRKN